MVHAFDDPSINGLHFVGVYKVRYDDAAASDSYDRVRAFLDHWVRGKSASE